MEKEKKTVTVEIQEGKKAVWNEQGILQLVDNKEANKPKEVTERIKTVYDAQCELEQRAELGDCEARQIIEEYNNLNSEETSTDLLAYLQLRIITAALNEGWEPQFKEDEKRWFPFIVLYTKEEIEQMSDKEKDDCQLLLLGGIASEGTACGSAYSVSYQGWTNTSAIIGLRLAYKTQALAKYAGRQFASVYARFFIGDKANNAIYWRDYEEA